MRARDADGRTPLQTASSDTVRAIFRPGHTPTLGEGGRERGREREGKGEGERGGRKEGSMGMVGSLPSATGANGASLASSSLPKKHERERREGGREAGREGEEGGREREAGPVHFGASAETIVSGDVVWKRGECIGEGAYGRVFAGLNERTGSLMAVKQIPVDIPQTTQEKEEGEQGEDEEGKGREGGVGAIIQGGQGGLGGLGGRANGRDGGDALRWERHAHHLAALERECNFYKVLRHAHVVEYFGAWLDRNAQCMFVFLEYVPGGSVASMLRRFGPFTEGLVRRYTRQVLLGLAFLHENKIVHRDVKGANILVTREGSCKLTDFGASKMFQADNSSGSLSNGSKSVIGSVYWMAPEVMKGTGHGRKADVWSLGCLVVEMFTGTHPWGEFDNAWTAMFAIARSERGPDLPEDASEDAKDFLQRCFQCDPAARPPAHELLRHPFVSS